MSRNDVIDLGNIGIRQVQISTLARTLGFKKGKDVNYKYKKSEAMKMLTYMIDKKHKGYENAECYLDTMRKNSLKSNLSKRGKVKPVCEVKEPRANGENKTLELLEKMANKIDKLERDMDYLKRMARCR